MICDTQEWERVGLLDRDSRGLAGMAGRECRSGRMSQGQKWRKQPGSESPQKDVSSLGFHLGVSGGQV